MTSYWYFVKENIRITFTSIRCLFFRRYEAYLIDGFMIWLSKTSCRVYYDVAKDRVTISHCKNLKLRNKNNYKTTKRQLHTLIYIPNILEKLKPQTTIDILIIEKEKQRLELSRKHTYLIINHRFAPPQLRQWKCYSVRLSYRLTDGD